MIINPIIPIWLMIIISIILILIIIYNKQLKSVIINKQNIEKTPKQEKMFKQHIAYSSIKIAIVILMFFINLRFMLPNGESIATNVDLNVLFVIDKSVSMRALDYDGNKERIEGVINDCCYIVDELNGCKFSIITFGDTAQRLIPFTTDSTMVQAELKAIVLEHDIYAKGSSMNIVNDILEKTLKNEAKRKEQTSKTVLFFITDGEITKEGEVLKAFSNIRPYISDGAVLGYGTEAGGKMLDSFYANDPNMDLNDDLYYISYRDEDFKEIIALSKLDEKNLKQIASDINIDYIRMSKTSNIKSKLDSIKQKVTASQTIEDKISSYKDIYYYFAIILGFLLVIDFIIQKRRM